MKLFGVFYNRRLAVPLGAVIVVVGLVYAGLELGWNVIDPQPVGSKSASVQSAGSARPSTGEHAPMQFTNVTEPSGLHFRHDAGAQGEKWYPETIGVGGGFFDYDGDGRVDILLVNG